MLGGLFARGDRQDLQYVLNVACIDDASDVAPVTVRATCRSCASQILGYDEIRQMPWAGFRRASDSQKLNFARRVNDETQVAVFDKELEETGAEG